MDCARLAQSSARMRALACLVVGLCLLVASGCARHFTAGPILGGDLASSVREKYAEKTPSGIFESVTTEKERNEVLNELMLLSDHNYQAFKAEFYSGNASFQTTFDLIALGLSTAGAFASSGAAPILSGASAAVQGAQGKFNARFYLEKTTETLVNAMDTVRANKKRLILESMANLSLSQYPIEAGVRDVVEYNDAGSLVNALVKISAESGSQRTAAEKKLEATEEKLARATRFEDDDAGKALTSYVFPRGAEKAADPAAMSALRDWMNKNGLEGYPAAMFLFGEGFADKRQLAVSALKLK